jgi:beta-glucosidase
MPFMIALKKSNPGCLMASYNKINGVHVSEDKKLLNDLIREEWGWDGTIMSDWSVFLKYESTIRLFYSAHICFEG